MSASDLVLVIDVGSTWCKAAYVDSTGAVIASSEKWIRDQRPFGHDSQSLERIWHGLADAVRGAGDQVDDPAPAALAIAARKAPGIWLDGAEEPVGLSLETASNAGRDAIDACYASHHWGNDDPFAYGYGIDLIGNTRWLRDNRPNDFARVRRAGNLHSWLLFRLTGEWATSHAGGPVQETWPDIVEELSGLSTDAYPTVYPDTRILGGIGSDAAEDLGLPVSTPVITGTHDGAAANIGSGALETGDACLTFGTNGVMRVVTGDRIPGRFGYTVTSHRWALVRDLPDVALLLDDVVDSICSHEGAVTPDLHNELAIRASVVPIGAQGLRLALFPGSDGLSVDEAKGLQDDPAVIYRAALEAIALGFAGLERYAQRTGAVPRRYMATGGATENDLLLRITNACLEAPITATSSESGLMGLASLAAVASGWYADVHEAVEAMTSGSPVVHAIDEERLDYRKLVASSALPRGTAPGDRVSPAQPSPS